MLEVYVDGLISLVELKQNFHTRTKLSTMCLKFTSATTWCKVHPYSFGKCTFKLRSRWDYVTRPAPSSDAPAVGNLL
jgi:hypothetical protein